MHTRTNGFEVDVQVGEDGLPRVQVHMGNKPILDTNALSVTGLQNLALALEKAAGTAYGELDAYYYRLSKGIGA